MDGSRCTEERWIVGWMDGRAALTFFSCAAFSSSLYPSKISASAAKISDAWKTKHKLHIGGG